MSGPKTRVTDTRGLTDVSTTAPTDGQVLVWDDAAGEYVPGAGGGFDPDDPLDYLTMIDQVTGDLVVATVESGAWVLTTANRRLTESGDVRVTESGDIRLLE